METTFISIHDLTEDAIILYSSDSVVDILGYTPDEIVSRSVWDFFPPEEVPYAKTFHKSRVDADKAAVLAYCRVKGKEGHWVGCECCFTVVYDVMVVCTSIYNRGLKTESTISLIRRSISTSANLDEERAAEAPIVRRTFSSSPNDPRYHMLSHISAKFTQPAKWDLHEPRAALFLNRFTRTAAIMYATQGIHEIIGIEAEAMRGRSFFYMISENCLQDAIKCLETAKANDSIAYLRFWYRDPRIDDFLETDDDSDEDMMAVDDSDMSSEGGAGLQTEDGLSVLSESPFSNAVRSGSSMDIDGDEGKTNSRNSSGDSAHPADTHEAIFGSEPADRSSASSSTASPRKERSTSGSRLPEHIELEAVISCASDGLVVCLRRARPSIPPRTQRPLPRTKPQGVFAAPWALEPVFPPREKIGIGTGPYVGPSLARTNVRRDSPTSLHPMQSRDQSDFMTAIRDQAIFAWALVGINGALSRYGTGNPLGESLPADGAPTWKKDRGHTEHYYRTADDEPLERDVPRKKTLSPLDSRSDFRIFGDPGLDRKSSSASRSVSSSNAHSSGGTPGRR